VANAVGMILGVLIAAVFASIGFVIAGASLVPLGIGNSTTYFTGNGATSAGLWGLLPLLFPFMVVSALLIGIFALYKSYVGD